MSIMPPTPARHGTDILLKSSNQVSDIGYTMLRDLVAKGYRWVVEISSRYGSVSVIRLLMSVRKLVPEIGIVPRDFRLEMAI